MQNETQGKVKVTSRIDPWGVTQFSVVDEIEGYTIVSIPLISGLHKSPGVGAGAL